MQHFKLIYFFMLLITSARVSFSCSNESSQANLRCWSDEIFRTRLAELSDLAIEILLSFFAQPFGVQFGWKHCWRRQDHTVFQQHVRLFKR